jgi:hypothetical protein
VGPIGVCGAIGAKGRPTASDLGLMPALGRGVDSCGANGTRRGVLVS